MKVPHWLQWLFGPTVYEVFIDGEFYTTEGYEGTLIYFTPDKLEVHKA